MLFSFLWAKDLSFLVMDLRGSSIAILGFSSVNRDSTGYHPSIVETCESEIDSFNSKSSTFLSQTG